LNTVIFDEQVAAQYDETCSHMFDNSVLDPTIELLEDMSEGGRVLEFAVGTGRVALPLKERGVDIHGIEISQPMVNQLHTKSTGNQIPVKIGDMTTCRV